MGMDVAIMQCPFCGFSRIASLNDDETGSISLPEEEEGTPGLEKIVTCHSLSSSCSSSSGVQRFPVSLVDLSKILLTAFCNF